MSCENLDFLCDSDYVKHALSLYLNNEQTFAVEFLERRKEKSLIIDYAACLLRVFNALITLDKVKIAETTQLLRELERKCIAEQPGWIKSIRTLFRGSRGLVPHRKSIIDDIERDIILADLLLCSSTLAIVEFDVSNYIKAALTLRRAHKIYCQTVRKIHELCGQFADEPSTLNLTTIDINNELSSPTSECYSANSSAFTVPLNKTSSSLNHILPKSHSTIFDPKSIRSNRFKRIPVIDGTDIDDVEFKRELLRLRGAVYFGYGLFQLAFSFLPPHFKLINFLGYQGDRDVGINCLHECRATIDFRSILAVVGLLWYYLVLKPFFSIENADLSEDILTATSILNEYEQFDQSALFLFFSGRRQRLKRKIKYSVIHYDAAIRCKNIPRELKILIMNELGICLLSELNFHDAMHYFNELKVSRFSKSYYMYLTICCRGAFEGSNEEFQEQYDGILKVINGITQKDGIVEKFINNRCNLVFPKKEKKEKIFWQLLCFEVMYFWSLLSGCDSSVLERIIIFCKDIKNPTADEPIFGLCNFMIATCFNFLKDIQSSILYYRMCVNECNENISTIKFFHIPAYSNYELSNLLLKYGNADEKLEAQKLIQHAKQFKNFDFEYRLKLKMQNVKI